MPSSSPSPVLRIIDREVVSQQSPDFIRFTVTTRIDNSAGTRSLRRACGTRVDKQEGTTWRGVFAEVCASGAAESSRLIAPGASATEEVTVSGYTNSTSLPRVEFGEAVPGEYRLWLTFAEVLPGGQLGRTVFVVSNAFRLR